MKNRIFIILLAVALLTMGVFSACDKVENITPKEIITEQVHTKGLWGKIKEILKIIRTALDVQVTFRTGQYEYKEIKHPDGSVEISIKCPNNGVCELSINGTGDISGQIGKSLYPTTNIHEYDNSIECLLALDEKDNIILLVYQNVDPEVCDQLFYSKKVNFTCPFVIDNPEVLGQLGVKEEGLTLFGEYDVHEIKEGKDVFKYIILKPGK